MLPMEVSSLIRTFPAKEKQDDFDASDMLRLDVPVGFFFTPEEQTDEEEKSISFFFGESVWLQIFLLTFAADRMLEGFEGDLGCCRRRMPTEDFWYLLTFLARECQFRCGSAADRRYRCYAISVSTAREVSASLEGNS